MQESFLSLYTDTRGEIQNPTKSAYSAKSEKDPKKDTGEEFSAVINEILEDGGRVENLDQEDLSITTANPEYPDNPSVLFILKKSSSTIIGMICIGLTSNGGEFAIDMFGSKVFGPKVQEALGYILIYRWIMPAFPPTTMCAFPLPSKFSNVP